MAGIYLHIPFCPHRCTYCDFYSTTRLQDRGRYVDALVAELALRSDESSSEIATVYIGGGSPSTLETTDLEKIFEALYRYYSISPNAEITIEANPDDLTRLRLEEWSRQPVNRLSVGIQSFDDAQLQQLGRRHTADAARHCIAEAQQLGFDNISIDLMYGLPGQSAASWTYSIEQALALETQHISAYHLSYEPGTVMYGKRHLAIDEEQSVAFFLDLRHRLSAAGFKHYEISNFALPGYESKHNSAYWNGTPYLGLGAAAHSYDGQSRSWNVSDIDEYMQSVLTGRRPFESETLTETDRYNETVMLSLRTAKGLDMASIEHGRQNSLLQKAQVFIHRGLLCQKNNFLILTEKGIFVSDSVIRDLMD